MSPELFSQALKVRSVSNDFCPCKQNALISKQEINQCGLRQETRK
jgi:hypothetical protein